MTKDVRLYVLSIPHHLGNLKACMCAFHVCTSIRSVRAYNPYSLDSVGFHCFTRSKLPLFAAVHGGRGRPGALCVSARGGGHAHTY